MNVVIEAKGLMKSYGAKTVVNHVDLQVEKGEIYGFLGRNGAGKSTFMNMITGIIQPTAGSFLLLNEGSIENVKHRIGVLPDYLTLYDSMTAVGHLKYFAKLNGQAVSTERCEEVLERVGFTEHTEKSGRVFIRYEKSSASPRRSSMIPNSSFWMNRHQVLMPNRPCTFKS